MLTWLNPAYGANNITPQGVEKVPVLFPTRWNETYMRIMCWVFFAYICPNTIEEKCQMMINQTVYAAQALILSTFFVHERIFWEF